MGRAFAMATRLPGGLLGMLALLVGIEAALPKLEDHILHTSHWSWIRVGKEATSAEARDARVLLFGDSMIKNGLLPHTMEAKGGPRTYNLSLLSGHSPASYFLLKRALDAGARPSAVVVDFERARLSRHPGDSEDNYPWSSLLTPAEALDLAWTTGDASFAGHLLVGELLASVRMRHDLRAAIQANLSGVKVNARWSHLVFRRNLRLNRGAIAQKPTPDIQNIELLPDAAKVFAHWEPFPGNLRYIERFFELARSRDIQVIWLMPPVSPGLQANFDQGGAEGEWEAFARRQLARNPGLTVVDGRRSGYPVSVFGDPVHLDRRGAAVLSSELAGVLGPSGTPAPGWHNLPSFPGAWDDPRTEDLDQTNAALAASGGRMRR